ncbi:MAG: 50S ribosomal protein L25/general stress protein Ctc [Eubacteriales bacterium]|nr:50S ribosomal protein L25/general stress protein Ctc [Eubacteriales bacterium]
MDIITVQHRQAGLKGKHLRKNGYVPGVIFGGSLDASVPVQVDEAAARRMMRTMREGTKVTLELDGEQTLAQIKEIDIERLTGTALHFSFQALRKEQMVNSVVHILLKNAEKMVGQVDRLLMEAPYASLPEDMIDTLTIDVDGMSVGTVITLADLPELRSDRIELHMDAATMVLRIVENGRPAYPRQAAE